MPPPTPLAIATSSLLRLLKEESSYHAELATQESRAQKLQTALEHPDRKEAGKGEGEDGEDGEADENAEWRLRQEVHFLPFWIWGSRFALFFSAMLLRCWGAAEGEGVVGVVCSEYDGGGRVGEG